MPWNGRRGQCKAYAADDLLAPDCRSLATRLRKEAGSEAPFGLLDAWDEKWREMMFGALMFLGTAFKQSWPFYITSDFSWFYMTLFLQLDVCCASACACRWFLDDESSRIDWSRSMALNWRQCMNWSFRAHWVLVLPRTPHELPAMPR